MTRNDRLYARANKELKARFLRWLKARGLSLADWIEAEMKAALKKLPPMQDDDNVIP
jgi:DNA-binding transcriptional MerR regulator